MKVNLQNDLIVINIYSWQNFLAQKEYPLQMHSLGKILEQVQSITCSLIFWLPLALPLLCGKLSGNCSVPLALPNNSTIYKRHIVFILNIVPLLHPLLFHRLSESIPYLGPLTSSLTRFASLFRDTCCDRAFGSYSKASGGRQHPPTRTFIFRNDALQYSEQVNSPGPLLQGADALWTFAMLQLPWW